MHRCDAEPNTTSGAQSPTTPANRRQIAQVVAADQLNTLCCALASNLFRIDRETVGRIERVSEVPTHGNQQRCIFVRSWYARGHPASKTDWIPVKKKKRSV